MRRFLSKYGDVIFLAAAILAMNARNILWYRTDLVFRAPFLNELTVLFGLALVMLLAATFCT